MNNPIPNWYKLVNTGLVNTLNSSNGILFLLINSIIHKRINDNDIGKKEFITLELKKLCKKNLPKYSWPVEYTYMDKLPTTRVGKIDFKKLQQDGKEKDND